MAKTVGRPSVRGNGWTIGVAGVFVTIVLTAFTAAQLTDGDLAPVASFVGVLLTGAVSFIGVVLQRSAEAREEAERSRANAIKAAEDKRLRLDAALRAAELIATRDRDNDNNATVTAALVALCDLGQVELAVALLFDLWTNGSAKITSDAAILVIDKAFAAREERRAQMLAAELLCRNAELLDPSQSTHWPHCLDGTWDPEMWPYTKLLIFDGLISMTIHSRPTDNSVASFAVRLYGAWEADHDPRVRYCLSRLAVHISAAISKEYEVVMHAGHTVTVEQLQRMNDGTLPRPQDALGRLISLREDAVAQWAAQCTGVDSRFGQLGTLA